MQTLNPLTSALASALVIFLWTSIIPAGCRGAKLPRQLHCISEIDIFTDAEGDQPFALTSYQVDEYVDLGQRRSSVSIHNLTTNEARIYYNRLVPSWSGRKFLSYNPTDETCRPESIGNWPLAVVRDYVSALCSNLRPDVRWRYTDAAIGPSSLLYAIEREQELFKFCGSALSKSYLNTVEVYCRKVSPTSTQQSQGGHYSKETLLVVHVFSQSQTELKKGTSLAKAHPGNPRDINIVVVGACGMPMSEGGERNGIPEDERDWDLDPNSDLHLGDDLICHPEDTIFVARYNLVTDYAPGTLVGKSLAELGDGHYDFHREPFMQPTGIGCWNRGAGDQSWQKSLTRNNPTAQLSAEYVTEFGVAGVSFVAYDRDRGLLRHDRNGRKEVYDLAKDLSYYVGEFLQAHEVFGSGVSLDDRELLKSDEERRLGRCTVFDREGSKMGNLVQWLLGLTGGAGLERHLGARTIDHVNYEVFELELPWSDHSKIPLVLQIPRERILLASKNSNSEALRLFVTYYAQPIVELADLDGETKPANGQHLVLRYMELWLYDEEKKERHLLNRLQFTEFSWQLDVEPTNDPRSGQTRSGELNMRLFDLEECHDERERQAELVVEFERSAKVELNEQLLGDLRRNKRQITEQVHSFLALVLELPRLNLVDLKLRVLNSGNLLATTQIVGLQKGLIDKRLLGRGNLFLFEPSYFSKIRSVTYHRYSLEECQLDLISWPRPVWLGWSQTMAICVLIEQDENIRHFLDNKKLSPEELERPDLFSFYSIKYSPSEERQEYLSPVGAASRSYGRLPDSNLVIYNRGEQEAAYEATPRVYSFRQLDSVGGKLLNSAALLAGLRYSTMAEEPQALNMNTRLLVPTNTRLGAFRFCQLACHMDDFCGSFSVCNRKGASECVLSTVRLTAERLQQVLKAAAENKQATKFPVRISDELKSQVLQLHRDDTCFIHPNDFSSQYTWSSVLRRVGFEQSKNQEVKRRLSLEECAGLSFEKNLQSLATETTFTHCPLDSICVVAGDKVNRDNLHGHCYDYVLTPQRAYNVQITSRLVAIVPGEKAPRKSSISDFESSIERLEEANLAKKFWGPTLRECARECSLHKAKCLAFDHCYTDGKALCSLLAFRSPVAEQNSYLAKLETERQLERDFELHMVSQMNCQHWYLKPDHLEVRLSHLLQLETKLGGDESSGERQKLIGEQERRIIEEDQRRSDEQVAELHELAEKQFGAGYKQVDASTGAKWFHFASLLVGVLLGTVATAYRHQLAAGASASYRWYQARRVRNEPISTQHLILDDPFST